MKHSACRRWAAAAAIFVAGSLGIAVPVLAELNGSAAVPHFAKAALHDSLRMPAGAVPATAVVLDALDPGAIIAMKHANSLSATKRLQIGIGRAVDERPEAHSEALQWFEVPGGMAAHWRIASPDAAALRIGLGAMALADGVELRFAGNAAVGTAYGPFTAKDVSNGTPTYWSPVLEGDAATMEVFLPSPLTPFSVSMTLKLVSHLVASPARGNMERLAKASQFCEVDIVCRAASDPALANAGRSVARMVFSDGLGGGSYVCTGTLLNPADGSSTPYFYSAAHCFSTQAAASTLTTHWFYERTGCGNEILSPNYVQVPGGATLLHASAASDALFLRLNASPPAGALFSAWDSATLAEATPLTAIHHPAGDVKKVSLGTMGGFGPSPLASGSFIIVNWSSIATGVTEGGSSGSGIFTALGSPASQYVFRGGLLGGGSSCTAAREALYDHYSRFDQVYPLISRFLSRASGAANYTALWWNPAESGWGLNVNQQGDIAFATLFTYDASGNPMWLVMSNGTRQGNADAFSGDLYRTTGPAFNAVPFTPISASNVTRVGTLSIAFSGADTATLTYGVNGVDVAKSIQKQVYGARAAQCRSTTESRAGATNFQDLWWNAAESGWGVNVTQQGDIIFATLFTYGADGQGLWLVMSAGTRQADGSYFGDLYRTTGPAFNAQPFTPIGAGNVTQVGTMRFRFTDAVNGTIGYSVNGAAVTKSITRQVFSSPVPLCAS